ncbi:hypothetical protein EDD21DRAFT_37905 [Dissophora ornata]|nr:hypothetical protein EDD21DRAFT_37905 [Dissophora ornata]
MAEINLNSREQAKPATSAAIALESLSVHEQHRVTEGIISSQFSGEPAGSTTPTGEPPAQRLRSSPRRTEQGPVRNRSSQSIADQETSAIGDAPEVQFDLKLMFVVPPVKTFKSPVGKENHLPRTSLGSRNMFKSMVKTDAPRFNWGRPQREVPEPQEEVKSSGNNDGGGLTVADTRIEGSDRDYRESVSVAKKMRHDPELPSDRKEFHPQISSTLSQHAAPLMEAHKPTAVHVAPRIHQMTVPTEHSKATVASTSASASPKLSKSQLLAGASSHSNMPFIKSTGTEGIAAIAQSLAVGSANAPPMASFFSPQEINIRTTDLAAQKQGLNSPGTAHSSAFTIQSSSSTAGLGRAELGGRQVFMVILTSIALKAKYLDLPLLQISNYLYNLLQVNSRPYTKLAQVGKGGSSKVYKVLASNGRVLALKKVSFEKVDQVTINGYVNEVRLLHRLAGNSRIIRLWDAEISNPKKSLSLVSQVSRRSDSRFVPENTVDQDVVR